MSQRVIIDTYRDVSLAMAEAKTHITPEVERGVKEKAAKLIANRDKLRVNASLQGLPNPEKPGLSIVDRGVIVEYGGDGIIEATDVILIPNPSDKGFVEKAKVLRGFTPDALAKQKFHIVETTVLASGKKQYAIVKQGPLKALLAKHQAFVNRVI